jgi:hypothetical protein
MLSFYLGRYPTKTIFTSHVCDAADDCGYRSKNNVQVPPPRFHFPHSGSASGSLFIKGAFTQHKRTQEPPRSLPRALARKGYVHLQRPRVYTFDFIKSPLACASRFRRKVNWVLQPILYFKEKDNEPQISEPIIYNRIIDAKTGKNPRCAPNVKLVCGGSVLCGVHLYNYVNQISVTMNFHFF